MSTDMTRHVAFGFEELAEKITHDRMLYFGYTPEQIAEAEAEDHARCDWNGDERNCLGDDEKSLHPIADELNDTAESVMFVLEYVMRPVAEVRARLAEVEAERDAKIRDAVLAAVRHADRQWCNALDKCTDDDVGSTAESVISKLRAEQVAWRPVVEAAVAWRGVDNGHGLILPATKEQIDALIAAVDALPPKGGGDG